MNRGCRGFSLTEIVVVLAIMILLLAIILPAVGPMRRRAKCRAAAAQVAGALRLARSLAIAQSAVYKVDFDTAADPDELRMYSAGKPDPDRVEKLPVGVKVLTPAPTVSFQQDGSCQGSPLPVKLQGGSKEYYEVRVSAASGRVRISKGTP